MTRLSFAIACLAAHRKVLTAKEERLLEKVIEGEPLSTVSTVENNDGSGQCWEFTEEARFRALQNQYLGELSRELT